MDDAAVAASQTAPSVARSRYNLLLGREPRIRECPKGLFRPSVEGHFLI